MDPRPRKSNAQMKFHDEYKDLFGDAPETIGQETESVNSESIFNFDPAHHQFLDNEVPSSPAKRLMGDELDFDPHEGKP